MKKKGSRNLDILLEGVIIDMTPAEVTWQNLSKLHALVSIYSEILLLENVSINITYV